MVVNKMSMQDLVDLYDKQYEAITLTTYELKLRYKKLLALKLGYGEGIEVMVRSQRGRAMKTKNIITPKRILLVTAFFIGVVLTTLAVGLPTWAWSTAHIHMQIDPLTISVESKVECLDRLFKIQHNNVADLNDEFVDAVLYCAKWLDEKNKREGGN